MINRELTEREREILGMIKPTTFRDIVDVVRKDVEQSRYDVKRELRNLRNGATNEITYGVINGVTNGRDRINNISGEICNILI